MPPKSPADLSLDDLFSSNARPKEEDDDEQARRERDPFASRGGRMRNDGVAGGGLPMEIDHEMDGMFGGGSKIKKKSEIGKSALDALSPVPPKRR
jgi:hypothetical protein